MSRDATCARERAKKIRMLILDVDGVLTDGVLHYDGEGRITKRFHVLDGVGIQLLQQAGIKVAVVTAGRDGACVESRIERMKVDAFYDGRVSKQQALEELRRRFDISWEEMAYMGDDWVDLIPLSLVGLPLSVPNARPHVRDMALYVTETPGGSGAVREAAEWLLACRGQLDMLFEQWKTPR